MWFHPIIGKSQFNSVLNLDSLPQFVTRENLTSSHVYSYNIVLKEVISNINMTMICKVVRRDIYLIIKFTSLSKKFQEPADRVFDNPNNPYNIILQDLECILGYFSV